MAVLRDEPFAMRIAALLPTPSLLRLKGLIRRHELRPASSWKGLDSLIEEGVEVVVFDPTVNGVTSVDDAATVLKKLKKISSAGLLAYVIPTPQSLRAVFRLSKLGLKYVFIHDLRRSEVGLCNAMERVAGNRISRSLLATLNMELAEMPAGLSGALTDLFERPQRYETATDLAREGGIPIKQLYREISKARLRTPKELVVLAKAIQVYGYMRFSEYPERLILEKLGYSDPQCLLRHVALIFGCRPSELRDPHRSDQELLALMGRIRKRTP